MLPHLGSSWPPPCDETLPTACTAWSDLDLTTPSGSTSRGDDDATEGLEYLVKGLVKGLVKV